MLTLLPDTNILLSVRLLDLLMRCHADGIVDVKWSDELLEEYERKLVDARGRTQDKAAASVARFKAAAPHGRIDPQAYQHLIPLMRGKDPDDHALSAAARAGGVDILLTENLADFPDEDLGPDCAAANAATVFTRLAELYPEDLAAVVRNSSANLTNPPLTPHDILDRLAEIGLNDMADLVRPHV